MLRSSSLPSYDPEYNLGHVAPVKNGLEIKNSRSYTDLNRISSVLRHTGDGVELEGDILIFLGCNIVGRIKRPSGYNWGCCCCRCTLKRVDKRTTCDNNLKSSPPKVLLNDPNALLFALLFAGCPKTEVDEDAWLLTG
jgi:hypothetical protein